MMVSWGRQRLPSPPAPPVTLSQSPRRADLGTLGDAVPFLLESGLVLGPLRRLLPDEVLELTGRVEAGQRLHLVGQFDLVGIERGRIVLPLGNGDRDLSIAAEVE